MGYARIGYCFFLTAAMAGLLYVLLLHPVSISADARPILEAVLGSLAPILMHVVQETFRVPASNPTQPAQPAKENP